MVERNNCYNVSKYDSSRGQQGLTGEANPECGAVIHVGTAGYSYTDWVGPYYPAGISKGEMLSFYAREFSFAEVNSSFYHLPSKFMFVQLVKKTPPGFVFSVKGYRSLTHERGSEAGEACRRFMEALSPLREASKLGVVLLQFPYSFVNSSANREYLVRLRDWLKPLPVAVEFRHQSWVSNDTWALLQSSDIGYTCVDGPRLRGLVGPAVVCTAGTAYVRFHGRNAGKWWRHKEAYERYDYLYSSDELKGWLPGLAKLAEQAKVVFVVFNNHFQGQAVQNARLLRQLLGTSSGGGDSGMAGKERRMWNSQEVR